MRKFLTTFLILGFLISYLPALAQKIGYIDFNKVVNQSNIGKRYQSKLKPDANRINKRLKEIDSKLTKLYRDINSSVLSDAIKKKKMEDIRKLEMEKLQLVREFQMKKAKLEKELLIKIGKVIKEYAEKNKYDLILTGGFERGILYIGDKIDITNDVLKYINKKLK
jgi:Skp family chaperone for outer membrane proteins